MAQAPSAETIAQQQEQVVPVMSQLPEPIQVAQTYQAAKPQYEVPTEKKQPVAPNYYGYGQPLIGYLAPVTLSGAGMLSFRL